MKKTVSSILIIILLFTLVSTAFALKCAVPTCKKDLSWEVQTFGPYTGYHYVYDNYGNRYNCHYTYLKDTNVLKCKNHHVNQTGTTTWPDSNHESKYCSQH